MDFSYLCTTDICNLSSNQRSVPGGIAAMGSQSQVDWRSYEDYCSPARSRRKRRRGSSSSGWDLQSHRRRGRNFLDGSFQKRGPAEFPPNASRIWGAIHAATDWYQVSRCGGICCGRITDHVIYAAPSPTICLQCSLSIFQSKRQWHISSLLWLLPSTWSSHLCQFCSSKELVDAPSWYGAHLLWWFYRLWLLSASIFLVKAVPSWP